ncbi:MAG: lipid-A-disaccharide synthase N-terminal domain-containing protein [Syntrophobacter sp.]
MAAPESFTLHQLAGWCADNFVLILGFTAQGLFSGRFLVQWIASEREGKSVVPLAFWYLSVLGGGMLFIYAILRRDPVFILGQGGGLFIYARNLYLIYRERARERQKKARPQSANN